MEVRLAEQRQRLPALAAVAGADQAEQWREILARVRVARAEEAVGTDDGEAHRVLLVIADALGLAAGVAKEPGVGGDVERAVLRVDSESVDVDRSRVLGRGL